jgi:hypothetical protein
MSTKYVPKVNDPVFMDGKAFIRYVVTRVDEKKQTADVKTVAGVEVLYRDVPGEAWSLTKAKMLSVMKEATEGH